MSFQFFLLHKPAIGMHSLVTAEVGELGVALEANLASERLHAAVNVRVLLQPAARGKCLSTFGTSVAASPHVARANVPLQVAWVGEHLVAVFAGKSSELSMDHLVPKKVGSPCETLIAMFTHIFISFVSVAVHHVLVQAEDEKHEKTTNQQQRTYM